MPRRQMRLNNFNLITCGKIIKPMYNTLLLFGDAPNLQGELDISSDVEKSV